MKKEMQLSEAAVEAAITAPAEKDPAPTAVQAAVSQTNTLIEQNCLYAVNKLRVLRDEIDHTMRAIQDKAGNARNEVIHLGEFVESAEKFHDIASEHLRSVREQFQLKPVQNGHA